MVNLLSAVSSISDSSAATSTQTSKAAGTDAAATAETPEQRQPAMPEVKQAARQLETFMESMNRYLEFRVDQESGRTVVTVKDKTTGDVVRQIPAEEVLRLAQNLGGSKSRTGLVSQTA